ncbi:sugar phosphate nucleotidyltransferase [Corynebacterium marquesiae]|uniref:sugar phosphate nucleotidyltransferase n=1 Tax=Corynebacterium marquesiae TaxID=2913503 RepID=UPI0038D0EAC9
MFPDWVIEPTAAMGEMIRVRQEHGGSVLLAVEPSQVSNYGVFDVDATDDDRVKRVVGMVKKPAVGDVPPNLVATGRYLLDRAILVLSAVLLPARAGSFSLLM